MTASTSYFPRNPKFTDAFERDLANDDVRHIGRDEPSVFKPLLERLGACLGAVPFLRVLAPGGKSH
jgi:hypothetical protein